MYARVYRRGAREFVLDFAEVQNGTSRPVIVVGDTTLMKRQCWAGTTRAASGPWPLMKIALAGSNRSDGAPKKKGLAHANPLIPLVGAIGFEPTTL